ncbi:OmpA family protein [Pontibacter sp. E15-1]|uniref:OmpA family protein n=1 Tax=Pontibacter sp. E15-1 TaxID=2919918 RepID=UPI001F4F2A41|nr:OmpA family protein [Pontibacter sp. E15-1]MCJ8166076.1 OmpA family protein [Pontibacter sp. E15-1]
MNYKYTPLYLVVAAMIGFAPVANGQSALRKANSYYENYAFALALQEYQKVAQRRTPDLETASRMADAYRLTRQTQQAENWYGKVVAMPGRDPMNLYHYADALRSNGKYTEAKEQYMAWGEEMPEKAEQAQELILATVSAEKWMSQPAVAEVTLAQGLNTAGFSDFSPVAYGKSGILFTSDRGVQPAKGKTAVFGWTGRPYLQLFTAEQNAQGGWASPVPLQDVINTAYHNATAAASPDGNTLYFTRTQAVPRKANVNADPTSWVEAPAADEKETLNRLEIFRAEKQGGTWGNITPFAYNKAADYSVGHPALAPDGNVLYFASDMPGSMGSTDIYFSVRRADGSWGEPINAGRTINTAGRESFPYVDADGKLYFASDGHSGMGGLDIFSAEGELDKWRTVRNLGYPVNSPKNDYGIMFTEAGERGLLSSNRDSENGTDDIYTFTILNKPVVLAITTLERKQDTRKRTVQVALPETRILVAQYKAQDSTVLLTDAHGEYFMDARKGRTYSFTGSKDGYLNMHTMAEIPTNAPDTVAVALLFDKNELEKAIVLSNIYYDLDKWDIRADAAKELDKLVLLLQSNPRVQMELSAHTDSRESKLYNQILSEKRAQAAVDYLVEHGIAQNRLKAKGYGKTRLVNRCADGVSCSEAEHQLNRRTEFVIKKN